MQNVYGNAKFLGSGAGSEIFGPRVSGERVRKCRVGMTLCVLNFTAPGANGVFVTSQVRQN